MTLSARFIDALPFWLSLTLVPVVILSAYLGSWWLWLTPFYGWVMMSVFDFAGGRDGENPDPQTEDSQLYWYRAVTLIWPPIQFIMIFGSIAFLVHSDHLQGVERYGYIAAIGILSGTVGINYSHELMHQKSKLERWLADILLAMTLYSHFRSEHLLVHHRYVGTPKDTVTARFNEGFHRFFPRVLHEGLRSAWQAEKTMQERKKKPVTDLSNPFWRYITLQAGFLALAAIIGGWAGIGFFMLQAFIAIWQLELVNYVEHYGLTRKHLGDGKYEHVQPRHSWNSSHKITNYLLINLQRHSDHHYKPDRRFPLLQTYTEDEAPHLPYGYPLMTVMAMIPPWWKWRMNPKVRKWRDTYYPEITDWHPYNKAKNPLPR